MALRLLFTFLRTWPLYVILIIKARILNDEYASRWYKDIESLRDSRFFYVMYSRPYYRDLLYLRLNLPVSLCFLIFGGDKIAIPRIDIGEGCHLEHPHGTHLNATRIGKYFKCFHNVTIGDNHGGKPTIGNHVAIGCGACVLGDITIGDNVNIGANSVILKDIPNNCTVVGNPAFIIKQDGVKVHIPL